MPTPTLPTRTACFLGTLGICWLVSGILFGVFLRDVRGGILFLFWSPLLFAIGWIPVGIFIIAMGNRILRVPTIILVMAGAVGGAFVILFPYFVLAIIAHGTANIAGWHWSYLLNSGSASGVVNGACAAVIYHQLLLWTIERARRKLNID